MIFTTMRVRSVICLLVAMDGFSTLLAQNMPFEESVAAEALKHDNYEDALIIYTENISRHSQNAAAYYDRGLIYLMQKSFQKAILDLNRALQLDPTKESHYSTLAVAYAEEGSNLQKPDDCDKALAISNEALRRDAWFFSGYAARGWANVCKAEVTQSMSLVDAAIADFTIFIKTTARNVRAYWGRGRAYRDKEEYDRALADANQALLLRPSSLTAYN